MKVDMARGMEDEATGFAHSGLPLEDEFDSIEVDVNEERVLPIEHLSCQDVQSTACQHDGDAMADPYRMTGASSIREDVGQDKGQELGRKGPKAASRTAPRRVGHCSLMRHRISGRRSVPGLGSILIARG